MERETGIEPATSSLGSWRSTAELLPPCCQILADLRKRESKFARCGDALAWSADSTIQHANLDFKWRS